MLYTIILIVQFLVAVALIVAVLLQSGKSAGLSGSIAGGSEALFGGKKKGLDELLAKVTAVLVTCFFIITLVLSCI
ncbi:MAG: preprotein translocase subunit SecG [Syntrophomonadaceae bacterium]|nr:preprotein translocase subunit SecG [Syntrophomonadaceae bacterium]